jgi:hypothetical protein
MAKYKNGFLGTLSGGISSFICYRSLFKNVIRGKPKVINPSQSAILATQQTKVSNTAAVWQLLKTIYLTKYWLTSNYKLSPWTFFFITNYNLFANFYPFPWANFVFPSGTITPTPITSITNSVAGQYNVVHFNPALLDGTQANSDKPRVIVFNVTKNRILTSSLLLTRTRNRANQIVYYGSGLNADDDIIAYLVFVNASETAFSSATWATLNI